MVADVQGLARAVAAELARPNPFSNVRFNAAANATLGRSAQRYSVAIYNRYRLLGNSLNARYARLLVEASKREGVGVLPEVGAFHLAHNWHRCGCKLGAACQVVPVLDRYNRLSTWLWLRQHSEQSGADHRAHIEDGEAGRYLWCDGCVSGPSRCMPTSGNFQTVVANHFYAMRRSRFCGGRGVDNSR